jgi:hypothetical protein|eukprot:COSAG01_NODE_4242_length_5211_cov_24.571401_7_plen_34_part_00
MMMAMVLARGVAAAIMTSMPGTTIGDHGCQAHY